SIAIYDGEKTYTWVSDNNSGRISPMKLYNWFILYNIEFFYESYWKPIAEENKLWKSHIANEIQLGSRKSLNIVINNNSTYAVITVEGDPDMPVPVPGKVYQKMDLVVDIKHNFLPVKIKRTYITGEHQRWTEYQITKIDQIREQIWFPLEGVATSYNPRSIPEKWEVYYKILRCEINKGLSNELFCLNYLPGTEVFDGVSQKREVIPPRRIQSGFTHPTFFDKLFGISYDETLKLFNEIPF
ncbi:MAG: hypothetical protein QME64_09475, partial [bacterium]|nr:hypothetical protein [bacterium]